LKQQLNNLSHSTDGSIPTYLFIFALGVLIGNTIGVIFALVLILFSLRRPELSLVLIFFSGFLKNIEMLQRIPVDLTVVGVLLLLFLSIVKMIKTGRLPVIRFFDSFIILQGCLVLFSVHFISSGTELHWWDASRFIAFNIPLYFGPFLLSMKEKEIKRSIHWIIYGVLIIASSAFHNLIMGKISLWHISSFGESYIHLALLICLGIIFFLNNILSAECVFSRRLINLALLGALVFLIPFIPSRSVFISIFLTFLFMTLKFPWKTRLRLIGIFVLLVVVIFLGLDLASQYGINVKRIYSYTGIYAESLNYRIEAFKNAVELFMDHPFIGIGMAEFMYLHGGKGNYPHNLFIEALVSFGILGVLFFWPHFIISFKYSLDILNQRRKRQFEIIAFWFIFFFFESFFSGSLSSSRTLWLFMGILSLLRMKDIHLGRADQEAAGKTE
jgi:O-antigen ligase